MPRNICVVAVTAYPWTAMAPLWRTANFSFNAASSDILRRRPTVSYSVEVEEARHGR